jgi:hypothetical protein
VTTNRDALVGPKPSRARRRARRRDDCARPELPPDAFSWRPGELVTRPLKRDNSSRPGKASIMDKVNHKARPARPGLCAICTHTDRTRIELLRVGGVPLRVLADQFGVSKDSVHRHFVSHVSQKRRAELVAGPAKVEQLANAAAEESKSLLDYLGIARSVLFNQFLNAAEAGDRAGVVNVAGRLLESLREIGRLTGELRQVSGISITNNTMNVIGSPEFLSLQEGLLTIARRHPEGKADIVGLLRGLDPTAAASPKMIEAEVVHE